jgi:hypothetical protein
MNKDNKDKEVVGLMRRITTFFMANIVSVRIPQNCFFFEYQEPNPTTNNKKRT